jgi:hypothetical protein
MRYLSVIILLVQFTYVTFADESSDLHVTNPTYYNYIGFTPTFIFMGMYGLVYSRAIDNHSIITAVAGYTDFDLSPIPFLRNDNWKYQNIYFGANYSLFPFSSDIFPHGLYIGMDLVPSIGFYTNRNDYSSGTGLDISIDILAGYSWIIFNRIKLSIDAFVNFNPPGINLSGVEWNSENSWTILPFFDVNIGFLF